jgi:hypothetical protein
MHDLDVRQAVRRWLGDLHAGDPDTRIVEEMGIWAGSVRVDVAVINGEIHGIELKSAKDTLERLPGQADLYNEVFDRVTLVVADKHLDKARDRVPDWWGLRSATGKRYTVSLNEVRPASRNPSPNPVQIARLLWRSEAIWVLEKYKLDRGFRSKPVDILARRLAGELALSTLKDEVRSALKARANWLGQLRVNDGDMAI